MDLNKQRRRTGALQRLQKQLESGVKVSENGTEKLTEKDIKRINAEIETLKSRV